ncbi:MAG: M20/M25/M40 family metallo-hydrolase [Rhodospirillaceae bacterium]
MNFKDIIDKSLTLEKAQDLLVDLVRVPSPQTELLEAEPLLAEFIRNSVEPRLLRMGFNNIRYDPMHNLIADFGENRTGKSLMFIGNAMNQPQATMKNAYLGEVVDGEDYGLPGRVVLGKGASEQKANLAAMLLAIESIIENHIPVEGKLIFLCCVSGETGRHDAIASVVEGQGVRADMALLGGTSLKITLGNRGRVDSFIRVRGKPCHSSAPIKGCNAITGAVEVIKLLQKNLHLVGSHPHLGKPTWAVNHIRSYPESTHTIQDECEITLDRRLLPGEDPNDAWAQIDELVKKIDGMKDPESGQAWAVEFTRGPFMYPSLLNDEAPIVKLISSSAEKMLGEKPETFYSTAAFDQGYLNHMGIPCANYGCGEDPFAHTDSDCASVDRTRDAAKVMACMIADYLGPVTLT